MIQKIKNKLLIVASVLVLGVPALVPAMAAAETNVQDNLCTGSNFEITASTGSLADCPAGDGGNSLNELLAKAINIISAIVGAVAVIMIIVGGFRYITSGGDSSNVSSAKNTIIYAIIGLIIVALAQVIVHFVLNNVPD